MRQQGTNFASVSRTLVLFILIITSIVSTSEAQSVNIKMEVISSGQEQAVGSVRMAADPWGKLHVFYAAWVDDDSMPDDGRDYLNAVIYTYQENENWSKPIDVLAPSNPNETGVLVNSVLIEPHSQQILVLWRSDSGLYLSISPVDQAGSARSWTTSKITNETTYWGSISLNPINGSLHLIYDGRFRDIFHLFSTDIGVSWSEPNIIASAERPGTAFAGTRLVIDSSGVLHVVWDENASYRNWTADAVWYARSINDGRDWEIKEIARSSPGQSSIGGINVSPTNNGELFLTWNRGAGSEDGRYYARSTDSGTTWSQPKEVWPNTPDLRGGQAGWSFVLTDADNAKYLITSIEDKQASLEGVSNSLRYALWNGDDWGQSFFLTTCEFPDATVSHGNRLHIVCPTFDRTNRIRYIKLVTSAPSVLPQKKPAIFVNRTDKNIMMDSSSNTEDESKNYTIDKSISNISYDINLSPAPSNNVFVSPLFLSSTLSFLLVFWFFLLSLRKK